MLYDTFLGFFTPHQAAAIGMVVSFILTFVTLNMRFSFLPQDQGRAFAINGALSKGKLRGVGIVFVIDFILVSVLFLPLSVEMLIYLGLLFLIMLSGYLDDAAEKPWNEYKKGLIDFVLSVATMVTFLSQNGTTIKFLAFELSIPYPVYFVLGVALIWVAINVTNCSDGVDGLCASLVIVTIMSFVILFSEKLGSVGTAGQLLVAVLLAYLYFNCSPSSMLMGDAGSRALGFFIAILAMKSGHPFSYLMLSLVLIIDGGLGLLKITLIRFFKLKVMTNLRTPIHDHVRKNLGWSDTQVVLRFVIIQVVLSILYVAL
ncbi:MULTISPECIES: phospho-N-acetylmuramoyl-pentapeptide-transferase [unclassified Butyrivibrio]|uniref:phospho-N-acetylmuramoyl-pentapeptide- transferase n=1 Tax=unclassified Butyrivibrio TaxID=2639466 RepID=UPI000888264F|nr:MULTISPECIES: phospho-N-acetylmuramoyl-pentapeptide-transferase [unclassified Butyrivibrio]SDB47044.1 phospho-N-acetylmuramoyl-pentapeptide-transferase [Butyrivibrio sp. INlla16]SEK84447.1 phospho-N-acetylmuramoyl-pentapeptide-transferase [Butyrivibrio sp. ob235]